MPKPERPDSGNAPSLASNLVRSGGNYIDTNMGLIKLAIGSAGVITMVFIYKKLHMGTQFTASTSIPAEYFERNVKLRGILKSIDPQSDALLVQHKPAVQWKLTEAPSETLALKMAGAKLTAGGREWTNSHLVDRLVWFRLLESNSEPMPVLLLARAKNGLFRRNINKYLISKGLAQLESTAENASHSLVYNEYLKEMKEVESTARKKGYGVWAQPSLWQKTKARFTRQ